MPLRVFGVRTPKRPWEGKVAVQNPVLKETPLAGISVHSRRRQPPDSRARTQSGEGVESGGRKPG
jgi:hypothetical protein